MNETWDLNTPEGRLAWTYWQFRSRWAARDQRHRIIDEVIDGKWHSIAPDDKALENVSPNLVQVALEDIADAASHVPAVRVRPSSPEPEAKERAAKMERIGQSYLEASEIELLDVITLQELIAHGLHAWVTVITPNGPRIEYRDARTCYPEPDFSTLNGVRRCIFARTVYVTQLPEEYQAAFAESYGRHSPSGGPCPNDQQVTLIEFYDENTITIGGVWEATPSAAFRPNPTDPQAFPAPSSGHVSVIFETVEHNLGVCPAVVGHRLRVGKAGANEPHGQLDQCVNILQGHIQLAALSLDYADQAVYSDMWVKDLIGEMSTGGGAYIQLGPNGAIGRVPPAVVGMTVYQELQQLIDNFHLAARWPKSRPGEIDQSIASAKFLESATGMMNTLIRGYHMILKRSFTKAIQLCFLWDKKYGGRKKRTVSGVHSNQQYTISYVPSEIDLEAEATVEYGLGLGRDPGQSMVLAIQGMQAGLLSREFAQENFDGINDVGLERIRIDVQQLTDLLMAKLLQMAESDAIPPEAILELIRAREDGKSFVEAYEKYVVKPQQEMQEQMLQGGLGEAMPGAAPGQPGPAAPPPPDAAGLLAALSGGGAPGEPEMIGRLSSPAGGPGSFIGTQYQT